ncbi:MAG: hypothetical protein K5678_05450 [Acetatifactor sp.]|nr:hypothetical protein [Acetatifactor sp.]
MNQNDINSASIRSFATASIICGLIAMATFFTGIIPLVAGGLGILFAVLSRREDRPFPSTSWWGIVLSAVGIFMGGLILTYALVTMVLPMMNDPAYYQEMKTLYMNTYGINLDELWGIQ